MIIFFTNQSGTLFFFIDIPWFLIWRNATKPHPVSLNPGSHLWDKHKHKLKKMQEEQAATVNLLAIYSYVQNNLRILIDHQNLSSPTAEKRLLECGFNAWGLTSTNVRKYIRYHSLWRKKSNLQYSSTRLFIIFFTPITFCIKWKRLKTLIVPFVQTSTKQWLQSFIRIVSLC